jgi:hypothetical protein
MGDATASRVDAALSRAFGVSLTSAAPGALYLSQLAQVRAAAFLTLPPCWRCSCACVC